MNGRRGEDDGKVGPRIFHWTRRRRKYRFFFHSAEKKKKLVLRFVITTIQPDWKWSKLAVLLKDIKYICTENGNIKRSFSQRGIYDMTMW